MELLDIAWTWIVTDGWQFIVSILAGTGAAKLFADYSFKKRLEKDKQVLNKELESHKKELNVELENHKQSLSVMTENSKFDYQRMMHDFSLYRTKKHEIYPELYKMMVGWHSEVKPLYKNWNWPNFSKFTKEIMKRYLIDNEINEDVADNLLMEWNTGNKNINEIKYRLKRVSYQKATKNLRDAFNFFVSNELFFTEDISKVSFELHRLGIKYFDAMYLYIMKKSYDLEIYDITEDAIERKIYEIDEKIATLKKLLKDELSIADYVAK
ncbi:hypothetical protein ACI48J_06015 [Paenibacillus chitinolyticus]|uniref:hypothetical protein n=1 Tax=Paenibacillus chitinolyticus TaxID=79263 RepID=UPI00386EED7F